MRIGVFIEGQLRMTEEQLRLTLDVLSDAFPTAGFAFAVWEDDYEERKTFVDRYMKPLGDVELFEQFEINYEPYLDNPNAIDDYQYYKKLNLPNPPRHPHQTKQILLHNELVKKHGHRYDVIVRTRYDSTASPVVNFDNLVKECFELPAMVTVMGRSTFADTMMDLLDRSDWINHHLGFRSETGELRYIDVRKTCMVNDSGLIIHRVVDWDSELVERLHNTKKLLAAEFGWHQVLVQGTSHHQTVHYDGGAMLTRCIRPVEYKRIKELMNV